MDMNQIPTIVAAMQACLSPDPNVRKAAEGAVKGAWKAPGFAVKLMQVVVEPSCELGVRQSAAIQFKQMMLKGWAVEDEKRQAGAFFLSDQDKAAIRQNMLEAVVVAPPLVRKQLAECLKSIILSDFPADLPTFMQQIFQNMQSQDNGRIHGGLLALRLITKKYEFRDHEDARKVKTEVIEAVFPFILQVFQSLIAANSAAVEAAELMKLICKIFWSSTYLSLPAILLQPAQYQGWITCFMQLLERPVPAEGQPADPEDRNQWPWWKLKKWVLHIVGRLQDRYGNLKRVKKDRPEEKAFAEAFERDCSANFLNAHLQLLFSLPKGAYLSPRVINLAVQYVAHSLDVDRLYQGILRPVMQELLVNVVVPQVYFSQEDADLWTEDPQEYIRKGYDIIEDLYSPRTAATNFLLELVSTKKRSKDSLTMLMAHLVQIVQGVTALGAAAPPEACRQLDGALLALGSINDKLKRTKPYKGQLEQMLTGFVAPLFQSPAGHLRAKACWICGQFADIRFAEGKGQGQSFMGLMQLVMQRLQDPELPVKVDAVVALRAFVEYVEGLDPLRPILPALLDVFFKLMNEVDNEDLVMTLETLVEKFEDEISPYAVGICKNLAAAFWKLMQTGEGDDEDEDDMGALAAVGCLRAVATILESISSVPALYVELEPILFPILAKMSTIEGQDVYEEILEILAYFTYVTPQISPQLWSIWPNLIEAMETWAIEYFENVLIPMDNYINRSPDHFAACKNPDYVGQCLHIAKKSLESEDDYMTEAEKYPAPKLFSIILLACRGRVDQYVGPMLQLLVAYLPKAESNMMKDLILVVVGSALYYNTPLALQALEAVGATQQVFALWFQLIYRTSKKTGKQLHFKLEHHKKVCVFGLTSLLALPQLPAGIAAGRGQMLVGTMKLLADLQKLAERAAEEEESEEEESGSEYEEEEDGEEEAAAGGAAGEGGEEEAGSGFHGIKVGAMRALGWAGGDESDSEDEWTDDEEFTSPIDAVDAHCYFSDALLAGGPQSALLAGLDAGAQAQVQQVYQHAQVRRAELAKAAAEEAAAKQRG